MEAAGERQYGIGRKGGTDLLLKQLQAQAECRPNSLIIKFDMCRAFQTIDRRKTTEAVGERLPKVANVLSVWCIGTSIHMW